MIQKRDSVFIVIVALAIGYVSYQLQSDKLILADPKPALNDTADLSNQGILVTPEGASVEELPDFKRYSDVKHKKAKFFAFLLPLIEQENARIATDRQRLLSIHRSLHQLSDAKLLQDKLLQNNTATISSSKNDALIDEKQRQWIYQLAAYYRLEPSSQSDNQLLKKLLNRVDIVPTSLALSQSANESAWGTSRFAVKGNNLFGQWCFRQGCGLIPRLRPEGARYEVAKFDTPAKSVASYMRNLNTNSAYLYFRELRSELRDEQQVLSGEYLAQGLESYSIRGQHYINELQAMIRVNKLARFDGEVTALSDG